MVESAEKFYLLGREFIFIKKVRDKYFYKHIDRETKTVDILEIIFSSIDKQIKKVDYFKLEDDEITESINIIRGIDGITEIDYYPTKPEIINIDGKNGSYNISIYKTYFESLNKNYQEIQEIELIKKGHCRHKLMLNTTTENNIFKTKADRQHQVVSRSIDKLTDYTKIITPTLKELESVLCCFVPKPKLEDEILIKEVKKEKKITPETTKEEISLEELEDNEEIVLTGLRSIKEYPETLYIYDRIYRIIGFKNHTVVYENTEENIIDLEIVLNDFDDIGEIKFVEYNKEANNSKGSKIKTMNLVIKSNNKINASLHNRRKESVLLNDIKLEDTLVKANLLINELGRAENGFIDIKTPKRNISIMTDKSNDRFYVDEYNNTQNFLSHSFITFKMISEYSQGIVRNIRESFMISKKENLVLIKK